MIIHSEPDVDVVQPCFNLGAEYPEASQLELDAEYNPDFGYMYRLWQGWNLLGTFYYSDKDNTWVAQHALF